MLPLSYILLKSAVLSQHAHSNINPILMFPHALNLVREHQGSDVGKDSSLVVRTNFGWGLRIMGLGVCVFKCRH